MTESGANQAAPSDQAGRHQRGRHPATLGHTTAQTPSIYGIAAAWEPTPRRRLGRIANYANPSEYAVLRELPETWLRRVEDEWLHQPEPKNVAVCPSGF